MTAMARLKNTLLLLSAVSVPEPEEEVLELPRKFLDGLSAFAHLWDGALKVLLPKATRRDDNLDYVSVDHRACGFEIIPLPKDEKTLRAHIHDAKIVLVPLTSLYVQLMARCREGGVPIVYDADNSPGVREGIIRAETKNALLRWRRILWVRRMESQFQAMIRTAAGAQLHGIPAYQAYAAESRAPLLYFDTRVRRSMLVTTQELNARAERLRAGRPLRLVYSGRWTRSKGVDDLPRVANALVRQRVPFTLDIFGGGVLGENLRGALAEMQLDNVRLHGQLPFPELIRFIKDECDVFVCCHRQGDPSATFMETLSAGIPLVGYDREGLRGLIAHSNAGWLSPPQDVGALASRIAQLDRDRDSLIAASDAAAAFTITRTFEEMFRTRVAHLHAIASGEF